MNHLPAACILFVTFVLATSCGSSSAITEGGDTYKDIALGTLATLLPLTIIAFILYIRRMRRFAKEAVTQQAEQYIGKIKELEKLLAEKIAQNHSLMKLMHKAELESNAGDLVNAVSEAAKGKYKMTDKEWHQLIQAIDELYPEFSRKLTDKLGRISQNELRVCYLMRIRLSNPQIINITDLPHSTVWRWTKKFKWIITEDEENSH